MQQSIAYLKHDWHKQILELVQAVEQHQHRGRAVGVHADIAVTE